MTVLGPSISPFQGRTTTLGKDGEMLQEHPQMKSRISSTDDDEGDGDDHAAYLWWRSAAGYEECARLAGRPEAAASVASVLSPRVRVLREMERLALVAPEGLDEVRQKLFAYRAGDFWVPTGGLSKEEMDIPATNTVLLAGFAGSGKSSLVNLMYSVLGRAGLIPFAQTSSGEEASNTLHLSVRFVLILSSSFANPRSKSNGVRESY